MTELYWNRNQNVVFVHVCDFVHVFVLDVVFMDKFVLKKKQKKNTKFRPWMFTRPCGVYIRTSCEMSEDGYEDNCPRAYKVLASKMAINVLYIWVNILAVEECSMLKIDTVAWRCMIMFPHLSFVCCGLFTLLTCRCCFLYL